jgi:hypothetical protein
MKSKIKSNLRIMAIVAIALLMVTVLRTGISTAAMMPEEEEHVKVNICHATKSEKNPYEALSVSKGHDGHDGHDEHDSHDGHVLDFAYTGPLHDGKPSKDGDEWCLAQRTVAPTSVTFTNATCDTKGSYTVPTTAGVEYLVGDQVVAAGTYTVTAPANVTVTARVIKGYFLKKDAVTSWSYSFSAATNCQTVLSATTTTTTPAPQVKVTPRGAANAGGQGNLAVIGLGVSTVLLVAGVALRKFAL